MAEKSVETILQELDLGLNMFMSHAQPKDVRRVFKWATKVRLDAKKKIDELLDLGL